MLKAIKIQIYPNKQQINYINNLLGCCRFIYNNCLSYKIDKYQNNNENISFSSLGKYLTNLKTKEEYDWLNNIHSKVLQQSLINLNESYNNFFKYKKGFPKFKSKKEYKQSCRFPIDAIIGINNNKLNLIKKLLNITFKCSDKDKNYLNKYQDKIKSITLIKTKSKKYYCSILINSNENKILPKNDNIIGLDLGIKTFIVDSQGNKYENIKIFHKYEKQIKKLQRQLSKKESKSNNFQKCRIKLARKYEKITNIKKHYLHNITSKIINENQIIVIEDLDVAGLLKNKNLAKSIQELNLSEFKSQLVYKSEWYGRNLIIIDRYFPSSKTCSNCGYINKNLTLSDREWICPECGMKHDRDKNAAINICNEGERIYKKQIGKSYPEFTLEDYPPMDDIVIRNNNALKSSDRLIQEKLNIE